MQWHTDLARAILLQVEKNPYVNAPTTPKVEGYNNDQISYHIMLLAEAGLIKAMNCSTGLGVQWAATRLTYDGHEFLEKARSESVWQKAKALALDRAGTLSLEAIKIALSEVVKVAITGKP